MKGPKKAPGDHLDRLPDVNIFINLSFLSKHFPSESRGEKGFWPLAVCGKTAFWHSCEEVREARDDAAISALLVL